MFRSNGLAEFSFERNGTREHSMTSLSNRGLGVIILNFNNVEYLTACMRHLRAALTGIRHEIWLVDNNSSDGTAEFVRSQFPEVHVIESPFNGGFSAGNNLALVRMGLGPEGKERLPSFPHVLFLNPDTEVSQPALMQMLAYMESHPDVGVVGPRLTRPNGELDLGCKRGEPTPLTSFLHLSGLSRILPRSRLLARYHMGHIGESDTADVDSVVGACMMMRTRALQQVGLLDETSFFMYGEDLDYCVRFRRAGWRVVYLGMARVLHHKGAATRKRSGQMILEFHRAMASFHRKHYASGTPVLVNLFIYGAVWMLGRLKFMLNLMRTPDRRYVGSARTC